MHMHMRHAHAHVHVVMCHVWCVIYDLDPQRQLVVWPRLSPQPGEPAHFVVLVAIVCGSPHSHHERGLQSQEQHKRQLPPYCCRRDPDTARGKVRGRRQ
jgi:hypothetical protein